MDVSLHNPVTEEIEIRSISLDDSDRLQASHARLSPETQYRRFLGHKPELTPADARYLVDVDGCDHFALVATLEDEIIGVARFVRLPDRPEAAEFAVVVGDAHQGRGLATRMLRCLAAAATERGIERFVATILTDNLAIRRLMNKVANGPVRECRDGIVAEVDFDLAPVPAMIAGCAGS